MSNLFFNQFSSNLFVVRPFPNWYYIARSIDAQSQPGPSRPTLAQLRPSIDLVPFDRLSRLAHNWSKKRIYHYTNTLNLSLIVKIYSQSLTNRQIGLKIETSAVNIANRSIVAENEPTLIECRSIDRRSTSELSSWL